MCGRPPSTYLTSCPRVPSHVLPYLTSCPARVPMSYPTSPVILQEFPGPTLPHQLSCKSSHVLPYLTSCPARVPMSYTTSPVILQEFPGPTLPHQLSCKSFHVLHYLTSCSARVPTSYTTSPVVLQALTTFIRGNLQPYLFRENSQPLGREVFG